MGEDYGTLVSELSSSIIGDSITQNLLLGFDRDLSIAGRAMVKTANGNICQKLVKIERPGIALYRYA